ncbi:DMT family transporter [Methylomicrobium lacus]|uniref:DMT family transporter n=1 Tax=Methylomicrobium lacus TaxID=136992 RepID=UPI0035A99AF1
MTRSRDKKYAYCAAIFSAVLMGSLGLVVRSISADASIIAFARMGLGCVFLLGFLGLTRSLHALKVAMSPCLMASGLSIGFCVWFYIQAMAHTSLANAVFLLYLGPIFAVGFAYFVLRETIALCNGLLMSLAFLGFLFVLRFGFSFSGEGALGYVYGVLSALSYALVIITNRKIPARVPPLGRAFYQLLIAALSLIPFLAGHEFDVSLEDLPWLLAAGFFQGFLGLTFMIFAIRHLTAYEFGILSYLEPVIATLIGVMIYAEPMSPLQAVGGSLILLSGLAQIWASPANRSPATRSP